MLTPKATNGLPQPLKDTEGCPTALRMSRPGGSGRSPAKAKTAPSAGWAAASAIPNGYRSQRPAYSVPQLYAPIIARPQCARKGRGNEKRDAWCVRLAASSLRSPTATPPTRQGGAFREEAPPFLTHIDRATESMVPGSVPCQFSFSSHAQPADEVRSAVQLLAESVRWSDLLGGVLSVSLL